MNRSIFSTTAFCVYCAIEMTASASVLAQKVTTLDEPVRIGIYGKLAELYPHSNAVVWSDSLSYKIFSESGHQLSVLAFPPKRLPISLLNDEIDIFVASANSVFEHQKHFLKSKFPTSMLTWSIYYDTRMGWQPQWPPAGAMLEKLGKSRLSSDPLTKIYGLNVTQADTYDAIIKMVNLERIDYWVEASGGVASATGSLLKGEAEGFSLEPLFSIGTYMWFQNTERGHILRDTYDQGCLALLNSGEYLTTYYKNDKRVTNTRTGEETVKFIRELFPELNIRDQVIPVH